MATSRKDGQTPQNGILPYSKPFAHTCSFCRVQEIDLGMKDASNNGSTMISTVRYRGTRVFEGASNKCAFFADCLRRLLPTLRSIKSERVGTADMSQPQNWIYEIRFVTIRERQILEDGTGRWKYVGGLLPQAITRPEWQDYIPMTFNNDPSAEIVPQRPFLYDYTNKRSTDWAQKCLKQCEESHSSCEQSRPVHVPSKLLHIDHSERDESLLVKLCYTASHGHTEEGKFKYATLSYCWGGPQDFRLDATSEEKLLRGIPVTLLPKTIVDAVKIVFSLGISWIWIDSLCIRQDDTSDKAIEIAQMHRVYGSSSITISATRADSCQQGFLHPCSSPPLGRVSYRLPLALSTGKLGSVILSKTNKVAAIDHRSWTLQEHLLARRVLRFTDYGQHWSCGATSKFEFSNQFYPLRAYKQGIEQICKLAKRIQESHDSFYSVDDWMDIVQQYTRRQLTVASDKLLAISAIAEAWNPESKDTYLAGIWESHLPMGLMWGCKSPRLESPSATYVAPSWSWASISGSIEWTGNILDEVDPEFGIEHCFVELATDHAPYGAVKNGNLVIRGLLQKTTIEDTQPQAVSVDETAPELDLSYAYTALDFDGEILKAKVADSHLCCLQVTVFNEEHMTGPSGLILTSKDNVEFTRIGMFEFMSTTDDLLEEMDDDDIMDEKYKVKKQAVQAAAFRNILPRTFFLI